MEPLLKIDGFEMPTPSGITVTYQDLDSSDTGRNANGVMIRERIRTGVIKLTISWRVLYAEEMSRILTAVKPAFFTVRFYDPETASFRDATMYVGDRESTFYTLRNDLIMYTDFEISLIEQ